MGHFDVEVSECFISVNVSVSGFLSGVNLRNTQVTK